MCVLIVVPASLPESRVSQSGGSAVGAAADGPGGAGVPVRAGHEQPAEAQRCWRPFEGGQRG